jgi:hypothetical protein
MLALEDFDIPSDEEEEYDEDWLIHILIDRAIFQ